MVLTNNSLLAGHVHLGDHVYLAGRAAVQQYVRVGESVMVAGMSGLTQDAAPFTRVYGYPARVIGVNRVNLERRGVDGERIADIERAYRILFRSGSKPVDAFARVREELPLSLEAEQMVAFLEKAERGFARAR